MSKQSFNNISWSHQPENHNRLRANRKIWWEVSKSFGPLGEDGYPTYPLKKV